MPPSRRRSCANDAADRRRHSRIDIGIVIQVVDAATKRAYSAMTRDISFTGISIVQSAMPTLNSYVVIQLPRRRQKFDAVRCQVVHVRDLADGLFCIGCAFVSIEEGAAAAANKSHAPANTGAKAPEPAAPRRAGRIASGCAVGPRTVGRDYAPWGGSAVSRISNASASFSFSSTFASATSFTFDDGGPFFTRSSSGATSFSGPSATISTRRSVRFAPTP